MTICHGCNQPLEPLAAIRTYHAGCDPWGRAEMLERLLGRMLASNEMSNGWKSEIQAALASRPVQWKGREG